jgi:hypothetical protein
MGGELVQLTLFPCPVPSIPRSCRINFEEFCVLADSLAGRAQQTSAPASSVQAQRQSSPLRPQHSAQPSKATLSLATAPPSRPSLSVPIAPPSRPIGTPLGTSPSPIHPKAPSSALAMPASDDPRRAALLTAFKRYDADSSGRCESRHLRPACQLSAVTSPPTHILA